MRQILRDYNTYWWRTFTNLSGVREEGIKQDMRAANAKETERHREEEREKNRMEE